MQEIFQEEIISQSNDKYQLQSQFKIDLSLKRDELRQFQYPNNQQTPQKVQKWKLLQPIPVKTGRNLLAMLEKECSSGSSTDLSFSGEDKDQFDHHNSGMVQMRKALSSPTTPEQHQKILWMTQIRIYCQNPFAANQILSNSNQSEYQCLKTYSDEFYDTQTNQ